MASPRFWYGPLDITYGVEIECVCEYPKGLFGSDYHGEMAFQEALIEIIGKIGCPVNGWSGTFENESYYKWTVKHDPSIRLPQELKADKDYGRAEIVSPILKWGHQGEYAEESNRQLTAVVEATKARFDLRTNDSCGLHIHLGHCSDRTGPPKFPFSTLQNLCFLVVAFEFIIATLLPIERARIESNAYCQMPSQQPTFRDMHIFQRLKRVHECETIKDLKECMCPVSRNVAFNLLALDKFGSVEMRCFQIDTIDPRRIHAYIGFVTALLLYAHESTAVEINDIVRHCVNPLYTIFHLFCDIGVEDHVFETLAGTLRLDSAEDILGPWDYRTFPIHVQPADPKVEPNPLTLLEQLTERQRARIRLVNEHEHPSSPVSFRDLSASPPEDRASNRGTADNPTWNWLQDSGPLDPPQRGDEDRTASPNPKPRITLVDNTDEDPAGPASFPFVSFTYPQDNAADVQPSPPSSSANIETLSNPPSDLPSPDCSLGLYSHTNSHDLRNDSSRGRSRVSDGLQDDLVSQAESYQAPQIVWELPEEGRKQKEKNEEQQEAKSKVSSTAGESSGSSSLEEKEEEDIKDVKQTRGRALSLRERIGGWFSGMGV